MRVPKNAGSLTLREIKWLYSGDALSDHASVFKNTEIQADIKIYSQFPG